MTAEDSYLLAFLFAVLWMTQSYNVRRLKKELLIYKTGYTTARIILSETERDLQSNVPAHDIVTELKLERKKLTADIDTALRGYH